MTRRSPRLAGALAVALLLSTQTLLADDTADEADLHFEMGAELYRNREYRPALEHFLISNRLVPNRNVVFNIARSYEQLPGHYPDAHRYYVQALEGETDPAAQRSIREALARISPNVAQLNIATEPPGATIYIDRRDLGPRGQSPRLLAYQPGRVRVIAELAGYEPAVAENVELRLGDTATVRLQLTRILGTVHVESDVAGAAVRADADDGPVVCTAPCDVPLPPGLHALYVSAPGHQTHREQVDVVARETLTSRVTLPPITGTLVVSTDERDALIEVDGRPMGFTPSVVNVPVGRREVVISRAGFRTVRRTVDVGAATQERVDVTLRQVEEVSAASRTAESIEDAPSSVSVVTGQEIRAMAYPTIAEALRGVRGVSISDDRNYLSLGFRGFSRPGDYGNRVLVLLDGHPTNDNWLNSSYVGYDARTDLDDVERIEVVRGPGSVLYGTGAFSGVVNVVTRGRAANNGVELGLSTNEYGTARARVGLRYRANDHAGVWLSVSGARSPGRDFYFGELVRPATGMSPAFDGNVRNADGFDAGTITGRAWYRALTLQWLLHSRSKNIPTGAFDTALGVPGSYLADTRGLLELRFEPQLSSTLQLMSRAFFNHYEYRSTLNNTDGGATRETFDGSWAGAEARLAWTPSSLFRLNLGAEGQFHFQVDQTSQLVGSSTYALNDAHPFQIVAGYLAADLTPSEALRLSAAVRADWYSTFGVSVNPRVALIVHPYERGNLKVMAGRAFRAPSIYELFYNDGGMTQVSPDTGSLRPETIWSGEVEFSHRFSSTVTGLVSVYGNYIDDLIGLRDATGRVGVVRYENVNAPVLTLGAEAEVRREWRQGWMLSASYAYQNSQYLTSSDTEALRNVPNAPEHLFSARAAAPIVPELFTLMSRLSVEGPRWDRNDRADDPAQQRVPGGLIWDLVLSGRAERWNLRYAAGVYNLFDWQHRTPISREFPDALRSVPQNGRTFLASASITFW